MWRTSVTLGLRAAMSAAIVALSSVEQSSTITIHVNSGLVKRIANGLLEESPVVVTGDDDPNARFGRSR